LDNDGDGAIDFPADPGCYAPAEGPENPKCQNGLDDDADGAIDFDGGAAAGVAPGSQTAPDAQCVGKPWRDRETASSCGLGAELAFLLPLLGALRGRRRASAGAPARTCSEIP
jgi:hypothetical protein